jgi:hypothetical protein
MERMEEGLGLNAFDQRFKAHFQQTSTDGFLRAVAAFIQLALFI